MLQTNPENYVYGQSKRSASKKNDTARDFFDLGRASAFLEKQREQLQQDMALNMAQLVQLQQAKLQYTDILGQVTKEQQSLNEMLAQVAPPPAAVAGYPGGIPPTGLEGQGSLPADAGQALALPDMAAMGGQGQSVMPGGPGALPPYMG